MDALWLDYQQNQPLRWAGPALLALALAALVLTGAYYLELNQQVSVWEGTQERMERDQGWQPADGRYAGREAEELALEVKRANEVLRQLTLPWDDLFQAVESSSGKEIALLALEPDTEKQVVVIRGEARDFAGLLNYVTQLERREVFGPVYLQSHQVQQDDPDKPVRFSLLADWRGKP